MIKEKNNFLIIFVFLVGSMSLLLGLLKINSLGADFIANINKNEALSIDSDITDLPFNAVDGDLNTFFHSKQNILSGKIELNYKHLLNPDSIFIIDQMNFSSRLPLKIIIKGIVDDKEHVLFSGETKNYIKSWMFSQNKYLQIPITNNNLKFSRFKLDFYNTLGDNYLTFSELSIIDYNANFIITLLCPYMVVALFFYLLAIALIKTNLQRRCKLFLYAEPEKEIWSNNFLFVVIGLFLVSWVISQWPVLNSGYSGDDFKNSMTRGNIIISGSSINQYVLNGITSWMKVGRFFPTAVFFGTIWHYFLSSVTLYKVGTIAFLLINSAMFAFFLFKLTKSKSVSLLMFGTMTLFLTIRSWHDAIVGYVPLISMVIFFLLLALILFIKGTEKNSKLFLVLSSIAFSISLTTYEISFCFLPLFFFVGFFVLNKSVNRFNIRELLKVCIYPSVVWLIIVVINIILRVEFGSNYVGIQVSFDITKIVETFFFQISGTFPWLIWTKTCVSLFDIPVALIGSTCFGIAFGLCLWRMKLSNINSIFLISLSILWIIFSAAIVSLSGRYQDEIKTWGMAYLPVLSQYYGLGVLMIGIVGFFVAVISKLKENMRIILITILSFWSSSVWLTTFNSNDYVVSTIVNPTWKWPRQILTNSLANNFFTGIEESSILIIDRSDGIWRYDSGFFYQNLNKKYKVFYFDEFAEITNSDVKKPFYLVRLAAIGENTGEVYVIKINEVQKKEAELLYKLGETRVYTQDKHGYELKKYETPITPKIRIENFYNKIPWAGSEN